MVSIKKRLVALLMTLVMALSLSVSAFAAEPIDVAASDPAVSVSEDASTRAAGDVIAGASGTIYNGSGFLYVDLPTWNLWANIQAGIDYTSQNAPVTCTVVTPNGNELYLGTIAGSGSRTEYAEIGFAPAGRYEFYFSSANTEPFDVVGIIFD